MRHRRGRGSPFASPGVLHLASEEDLIKLQRGEKPKTVSKRPPKLKKDQADRAQLLAWDLEKLGFLVLTEKQWRERTEEDGRVEAVREYRFTRYHPAEELARLPWKMHDWRNDFYFPAVGLIVEVDGGFNEYGGGHHATQTDMNKLTTASLLGYRVLRLRADTVERGRLRVAEQVKEVVEWLLRKAISSQ